MAATKLDGISIVLPCRNREARIGAAVQQACQAGRASARDHEVIVVDDGSRDSTCAVAIRLGAGDPCVRVLRHPHGRGYGAALRTGIAAARLPWVLLTDGGLTFELRDLARFVPLAGGCDLIAGYRTDRRGPRTAWSRLMDGVQALRARESGCAAVLVRRSLLDEIELTSSDGVIFAELLVHARARGARQCELGVPA